METYLQRNHLIEEKDILLTEMKSALKFYYQKLDTLANQLKELSKMLLLSLNKKSLTVLIENSRRALLPFTVISFCNFQEFYYYQNFVLAIFETI